MNYLPIISTTILLVSGLGALALYFKKGGDKEASELDQNTIRAYRDSETKLKQENASLKIQLQTKDDLIARLVEDGKSSHKSNK